MRCALSSVDQARQQEAAAQAVGSGCRRGLHVVAEGGELLVELLDPLAPAAGLHLVHGKHHPQRKKVAYQALVALFRVGGVVHGFVLLTMTKHPTCQEPTMSEQDFGDFAMHLPCA